MDFTEIQELNKLINYSHSYDAAPIIKEHGRENNAKDLQATHYVSIAEAGFSEIEQLLKEIDLVAQSMMHAVQHQQEELEFRVKAQTHYQPPPSQIQTSPDSDELLFLPKRREPVRSSLVGRSSVMFRASLTKNPYLKKEKRIKIFYFGNPISKVLSYSNQTTVAELIDRAIFAYLEDPGLDKHRIRTTNTQAYVLRVPDDNSGFKADMELEPLDRHRLVIEMGFDSLVMLSNNTMQVEFNQKDESLITSLPTRANMSVVRIYDEFSQELFTKNFHKDERIEDIVALILKTGRYVMDKFYLTETVDDELEIGQETLIGNLQTKKLYIKIKRFADEPIEEVEKLVERESSPSSKSQSKEEDSKSPKVSPKKGQIAAEECTVLTLTQASNYEQFQVVKVNARGSRQNRVIGIDQTKLYNYDQDVHNNTKEVSLFSKIFGKSTFGTKTPERLIKDILSIKDSADKGCILIECKEPDRVKVLEFEAEPQVRFRIFQKLTYLMGLLQRQPN